MNNTATGSCTLSDQDRMEDLKKAAEDKEYRRRLYREFGLDAETE